MLVVPYWAGFEHGFPLAQLAEGQLLPSFWVPNLIHTNGPKKLNTHITFTQGMNSKMSKKDRERAREIACANGAEIVAGVTRVDALNQIKSALNAKCAK